MITLSDAILAINPDAEFDYDDIDNIFWRRKTKPISKDLILQKYRELKDITRVVLVCVKTTICFYYNHDSAGNFIQMSKS